MKAWYYFVYCIKNIFNYQGRARRSEFWYFFLLQSIFCILGLVFVYFFFYFHGSNFNFGRLSLSTTKLYIFGVFGLIIFSVFVVMLLVELSVTVRRLHDINISGWWVLFPTLLEVIQAITVEIIKKDVSDVALVLNIIFLIVLAYPGTKGVNKYGPDPINRDNKKNESDLIGIEKSNLN